MTRSAFTLIELLVVITIIIVLLALLAPALDQAVYEAEMVSCAARLKGFGTAVTVYAIDHGRNYPYRPWVFEGGHRPNFLWAHNFRVYRKDERPMIRPYVGSINKQLQCPFNKQVHLDQTGNDGPNTGNNVAYSSYYMLYGWGYKGEEAMRKLGDRFGYEGSFFSILASDYDMVDIANGGSVGSHPDQGPEAIMTPYVLEDYNWLGAVHTLSRWTTAGGGKRSLIDMNFALADGTVIRLDSVVFEREPGVPDERMARVIETSNKSQTYYTHLPPDRY